MTWYFVNRGSKYWQQNWEHHVDLLEDDVYGPIYKVVVENDDTRFWNLWGAFPFSVSKLNQTVSLYLVAIFILLAVKPWYVDLKPGGKCRFSPR